MQELTPQDPRRIGRYRILARVGAGGMGQVFLGRSPSGRAVAVKVIHADLVRDPAFLARFRREVQAARLVSGAFTAAVIDANLDATPLWLTTEYISGPSLQHTVADQGPLPAPTVGTLAAGLAEALLSIHSVDLVHRDLKPSNVLLSEDGPRVIDFGIARAAQIGTLTQSGFVIGSPGFMSPEQAIADEITAASDVFSLGATLAFAATGRKPFGDAPTPALLYRVVHEEPDLEGLDDPALRALVHDCLAKSVAQRPTPQQILSRVGGDSELIGPIEAASWFPITERILTSPEHRATPETEAQQRALAGDSGATADLVAAPPGPPTGTPDAEKPVSDDGDADPPERTSTATPDVRAATGRGPTRRTLLLSGLATVATAGVATGLYLTRDTADESSAKAATSSPDTASYTLAPLKGHAPMSAVAFSPYRHDLGDQDLWLAGGSDDGHIRLWDAFDEGKAPITLTGHTDAVTAVAFSPDGKTLASAGEDETVRLWDVTKPSRPTPLSEPLVGHERAVRSVAFSPHKKTLASASEDGTVRLWDVTKPSRPTPLSEPLVGHERAVRSVAFSSDEKTLASSGEDGTVRLWDVSQPSHTTTLKRPLVGHTDTVNSVAFSPDGNTLASASFDKTVRLWNVTARRQLKVLTVTSNKPSDIGYAYSVAFSPDGRTLASGIQQTVRLWEVNSHRTATTLRAFSPRRLLPLARSVAWGPQGSGLFAGARDDGTIRLYYDHAFN